MQCGPKRTHSFLTICLNKIGNRKRTSKNFSILIAVMGSLKIALLQSFPVSVVLCLEKIENIDRMNESTFFS